MKNMMAEGKAAYMEEIELLIAAHSVTTDQMKDELTQSREQVSNAVEENGMLKLARDCMVEQCRDLAVLLEETKEKAAEAQSKWEQERILADGADVRNATSAQQVGLIIAILFWILVLVTTMTLFSGIYFLNYCN